MTAMKASSRPRYIHIGPRYRAVLINGPRVGSSRGDRSKHCRMPTAVCLNSSPLKYHPLSVGPICNIVLVRFGDVTLCDVIGIGMHDSAFASALWQMGIFVVKI